MPSSATGNCATANPKRRSKGNRAVLDVLNDIFNGWDVTQNQGRASETLLRRFALYNEAHSSEAAMSARGGITSPELV
jgi:hypothetical protein